MNELVLVADDDKDIVKSVQLNLQLLGYEVAVAFDGQEAVDKVIELQPALIISDIVMPKLDGFQVCKMLREDPRTKDVAIILLTARSIASDKVMGLSVGADDYIVKPFDSAELSARVESVLLRSAQRRDLSPLTQEASVNATEMKTYAKRQDKSGNEIDRRTKEE
jgi:DNA-binding response OmpR family regulator